MRSSAFRWKEFTLSTQECKIRNGLALQTRRLKGSSAISNEHQACTSTTVVVFFEASGVVRDSVPRHTHHVDDVSGAATMRVPQHTGPGSHTHGI